jgi:hypothetical protein
LSAHPHLQFIETLVCDLQQQGDKGIAAGRDLRLLTIEQQLAGKPTSVALAQLCPEDPKNYKQVMLLGTKNR